MSAFISFDFDHDEDLCNRLAVQSKHPESPFSIRDQSVKRALSGDWRERVQARIRAVDGVIVLCGAFTHMASGVSDEVAIAQEEAKPYFLLRGRSNQPCLKPQAALPTDKMYAWTWDNLKLLLAGKR